MILHNCASIYRQFVKLVLGGIFQFVIASCNNGRNEDTPALADMLSDKGFIVLRGNGFWQGVPEQSLIILPPNIHKTAFSHTDLLTVFAAARDCEQQSIIIGDNTGAALMWINEPERKNTELGALTILPEGVTPDVDGYSVFGDIAFYWEDKPQSAFETERKAQEVLSAFPGSVLMSPINYNPNFRVDDVMGGK